MKDSLKDKTVLGARRLMKKFPLCRGIITFGLVLALFVFHFSHAVASNTKKLVSLAMLFLFFTISCSFCAPMFRLDAQETLQEVDTRHLESEDIALASEEEVFAAAAVSETEEETPENPEAEGSEDIDKYSADEILALHASEGREAESGDIFAASPEAEKGDVSPDSPDAGGGNVSADDWSLLLVNNRHPIPDNYEFTLGRIMGSLQCDERIIPDLLDMLQGAKSDGISLEICSPYRSDERQVMLFEKKIKSYMKKGMSYMDAYKLSAQVVNVPGTSEHQIGLALDIYTGAYRTLDAGFGDTKEGIWLREHCSEYGFILRYPKGREYITGIEYEPWHFRYVGQKAAKVIMEQDITLEEYVELLENEA